MDMVRIELQPVGKTLEVPRGSPLQDLLFGFGVEFPCGGHGRCKGCRIRVIKGILPPTADERKILSAHDISDNWRLACRCRVTENVTLEINQWETAILADNSAFEFTPGEGAGLAIDLGTTTLVVQLLDLETGHVIGVRTGLNPQAAFGSDVMSRVQLAGLPEGAEKLRKCIREGIGAMILGLIRTCLPDGRRIRKTAIVGNTAMHHLFCGIDAEPLSHYPFEPPEDGLQTFSASELGWPGGDSPVRFLPCLGGFVGSDILAGVLATRLHESDSLTALVDLGTNGEVVVGRRGRMLCASTAAGPAFEGARITMGMRAATGAISEVRVAGGQPRCTVLGHGEARGICGSGLVDAVAAGLDLEIIDPSGRLSNGAKTWELVPPVSLTQNDVRELQLAKAAIAAAFRILLSQWGAAANEVSRVYLAGAFGNYVNLTSARRIGLIEFPENRIQPSGNTALLGAKLSLFQNGGEDPEFSWLRRQIRHVSLSTDPQFQETFVDCMSFPDQSSSEAANDPPEPVSS